MPSSKKSRQPPSLGDDVENTVARLSMDPDILTLLKNQMKQSMEKKSKIKNAKIMRAARDQVEKLLSARAEMFEQARSELYAEMDPHDAAYMLIKIGIPGPTCRASCAQEYSTGYARDLDEIRALWMAMAKRREALSELLLGEENMNRKRLLDRENNSVARLTQAKADCEEQGRIILSIC